MRFYQNVIRLKKIKLNMRLNLIQYVINNSGCNKNAIIKRRVINLSLDVMTSITCYLETVTGGANNFLSSGMASAVKYGT